MQESHQKNLIQQSEGELLLQQISDNVCYEKLLLSIINPLQLVSAEERKTLFVSSVETPLGVMIALSDENFLYLLEFADRKHLATRIIKLRDALHGLIDYNEPAPIILIKAELTLYFSGKLKSFKTPIKMIGTEFQQQAWSVLQQVPYAETLSYKAQACAIGKETAYRAVAHANSCNHLAIIIPCHRIINSNGTLGGYAGNLLRKKWLLEHEKDTFLAPNI